MSKVTDLYPILRAYASKYNSPYVDIDVFLDFLKNVAQHRVQEQPEWNKWLTNTGVVFWNELSGLVESDKCAVLTTMSGGGQIYMPHFYLEMLDKIYFDMDKMGNQPFPCEESLGITIPENQLTVINLKSDFGQFFEEEKDKEESDDDKTRGPRQITKVLFPENYGSALLLTSMIPRQFLEAAFLKVRHYLQITGNKEYILHKISSQLQNREKFLNDMLDQARIRPLECLNEIEKSGDFAYLFWTYFCGLVKNDIKKKNEMQSGDLAVIQAAYIIEICNAYYKTLATKKREKETAFRNLETCIGKHPFYYTKEEIYNFHTNKGVLLLGMYSSEELEECIKQKVSENNGYELPEWLIVKGDGGVNWYLKKEKYVPICAKMLVAIRPNIKTSVNKRWTNLLRDYRKESAMEKDADFESLLSSLTTDCNPALTAILNDERLVMAYQEMERNQTEIPPVLQIVRGGAVLPFSGLYAIYRKDVLNDVKMHLPLWYSFPVLAAIMSFFMRFKKPKTKNQPDEPAEDEVQVDKKTAAVKEMQGVAQAVKESLVPQGKSLDGYLEELEARWNRQIDKESRRNLTIDIQTLIRDSLRQMFRIHRKKKISKKGLEEFASRLISGSPVLSNLHGQDSLHLYVQLYMAKSLLNMKGNIELLL